MNASPTNSTVSWVQMPTRSDSSTPSQSASDDAHVPAGWLLEQVMRSVDDELLVLECRNAVGDSERLIRLLGRLTARVGSCCRPGCPLLAACGVGPVDVGWRGDHPAARGSLWSELEDLRQWLEPDRVETSTAWGDPWEELLHLRRRGSSILM